MRRRKIGRVKFLHGFQCRIYIRIDPILTTLTRINSQRKLVVHCIVLQPTDLTIFTPGSMLVKRGREGFTANFYTIQDIQNFQRDQFFSPAYRSPRNAMRV